MNLRLLLLAASALGALAALPAATAQTHQCGDIQLIFKNPDLQPQPDGFIHAEGQFFAQFQAIGDGADKIKVFGFSFGPYTAEFDETACSAPAWVTGAYLPNYRADRDPTDGFFIPVKTMLVPDGTYAAAVHAYDESNNELARFWARAVVDNCDNQTASAQEKCDTDAAQMQKHDSTAPWPIVLPGDGQALEGHTFTLEFGEALSNLTVYLNGKDISAEMVEWDGRLWDADYTPDYGPGGASGAVAPPCTQSYQTCEKYGPAYEWTTRPLTGSDFIRVEAYDLAGNRAVKDIHIGSSVAGGAVTAEVPILSASIESDRAEVAPGGQALFSFRLGNDGNGAAHPSAEAKGPEGWTFDWSPVHVAVGPGETKDQELTVHAGSKPGTYAVNVTFTFQAGAEQKVLAMPLTVVVSGTPESVSQSSSETEEAPLTPPLAPLALAIAAILGRRRAGPVAGGPPPTGPAR